MRRIDGQDHLIYDGMNVGPVNPDDSFQMDGGNIIYQNLEGSIVFNGQVYGEGFAPKLEGNFFAYYNIIDDVIRVFHNGVDVGNGESFSLSGNNIVFMQGENYSPYFLKFQPPDMIADIAARTKYHIILNGKDLGLGIFPLISE